MLANLIPSFAPSRQKLTNSGETLRGRKPLYLVDGVPQSTPLREGGRDGHTIDPAMIERIEVIHGANALQGLGASGGIINIITKRAPRQDGESFHDVSVAASTALPTRERQHRLSRLLCVRHAQRRISTSSAALPTPAKGCTTTATATPIAVNDVQGDLMDSQQPQPVRQGRLEHRRRPAPAAHRQPLRTAGQQRLPHRQRQHRHRPAGDVRTRWQRRRRPAQPVHFAEPGLHRQGPGRRLPAGAAVLGRFRGAVTAAATGATSGATAAIRTGSTSRRTCPRSRAASSAGRAATCSACALRATFGLDLARDTTYQELVRADIDWVPETTYESWSPFVQMEWWVADSVMLTGGLRYERGKLEVDDYLTIPDQRTSPAGVRAPASSSKAARRRPAKRCPTSAWCGKPPTR